MTTIKQCLRRYLMDESKERAVEFSLEGWTDYVPSDIPHQQNGYDCGEWRGTPCYGKGRTAEDGEKSKKHVKELDERESGLNGNSDCLTTPRELIGCDSIFQSMGFKKCARSGFLLPLITATQH